MSSQQQDKSNKSRIICTGLNTTILYQILNNIQEVQSKKLQVQDQVKTQLRIQNDIKQQLKEINKTITKLNVPFYDFFLRIFHPGKSYQQEVKVRQIIQAKILEGIPQMHFPLQCPLFSENTYQILGEFYLQKYPSQITQVLGHLNNQNAVWRLFNTTALQNPQSFKTITQQLRIHQDEFRRIIQKTIEISQNDYNNFIKIWEQYHIFLSRSSSIALSDLQGFKIAYKVLRLVDSSEKIIPPFLEKITMPMDDNERLERVLNYYTKKIVSYVNHGNLKSINIQEYTQIITENFFKNKILKILSTQKITAFWQQWSDILLADEHLVQDLITGSLVNQKSSIRQSSSERRQSNMQYDQIQLQ